MALNRDKKGNVVVLNQLTKLDVPADRILKEAEGKLESVIIIGFEKDTGEVYAASSCADGGTVLWLMESCKNLMMDV